MSRDELVEEEMKLLQNVNDLAQNMQQIANQMQSFARCAKCSELWRRRARGRAAAL